MSRASPFPSNTNRRPRSPPNGLTSPPATAPLSINRPPSRPVTPSGKAPPATATSPARPVRSGLRSRVPSNASTSYSRDGSNTAAVDGSFARLPQGRPSGSSTARPYTNGNNDDESPVSPAGLDALAAFKQAGTRRAKRDTDREEERRREWEKEDAKQRKMKERSMGRRTNGKAKPGDIDSILDDVKYEWESIMSQDFNPVELALSLLDENSQGREMESFQRTRRSLQKALKGTIDKNYQAFAGALPHHNSLINSLGASETQITNVKQSLQQVREAVANKRADLVQLWARGQQVEEMMKLLDQIEYLKSIPDKLETLMSEKRLLPAAALLMNSLKIINNHDMMEIGAMADLRSYLASQETSLREILIEELHAHLYVKTFWCDSRWVPYTIGQQDFPVVPFEEDLRANEKLDPSKSRERQHTRLFRYLHELTLRPNEPPADINYEDDSGVAGHIAVGDAAPESDSFSYIEHVLESLAVLGKLGMALDSVSQRIPTEIFNLIEATITEVNERVESTNRFSLMPTADQGRPTGVYVFSNSTASGLRLAALELSVKESNREVLRDLFWTLYSKLDAVVQGLRVISEVSNRIGSRRTFKDSTEAKPGSLFPLTEQWLPVQAEVRSLLHDYLVDEQSGATASRNPISSINEVLRQSMARTGAAPVTTRNLEQQTKVFRFADSDLKQTVKSLKTHEEQLSKALRETVPGLAKEGTDGTVQAAFSSIGTDDRISSAGHHPLLLAPDAFHVGILFQPTLAFLDRMVEILPAGVESARASSVFLDEFVLSVYLPQLEEKVTHLFHVAVSGPDAFREDVAFRALHPHPLIKAAVQITALVNTLCAMLQTTPFHKDNYSRLVLGIVIQFYQQCSDQFRDIVSRETDSATASPVILGAHWAQRDDIGACLSDFLNSHDDKEHVELGEREIRLELQALGDGQIAEDDVLPSTKDLGSLCNLYTSLIWFIEQLRTLRPPSDEPQTPLGLPDTAGMTPWSANLPLVSVLNANDPLQLPLTKEMTIRFFALLKTFQQLADVVLFSIRLDMRCRVIRHIDQMARRSSYRLEREATEPDPYIMELNNDLAKCDDAISTTLAEPQRRFVFDGLNTLISHLLISSSSHIRFVNERGAQKMIRNILALQQNLKTIHNGPKDGDLESAKKYWGLFSLTPQQMLAGIRQKRVYSFNEYQAMLNYMCGVDPQAKSRASTDKNYNSCLIDLHELAGQEVGEE